MEGTWLRTGPGKLSSQSRVMVELSTAPSQHSLSPSSSKLTLPGPATASPSSCCLHSVVLGQDDLWGIQAEGSSQLQDQG